MTANAGPPSRRVLRRRLQEAQEALEAAVPAAKPGRGWGFTEGLSAKTGPLSLEVEAWDDLFCEGCTEVVEKVAEILEVKDCDGEIPRANDDGECHGADGAKYCCLCGALLLYTLGDNGAWVETEAFVSDAANGQQARVAKRLDAEEAYGLQQALFVWGQTMLIEKAGEWERWQAERLVETVERVLAERAQPETGQQ